MSENYKNKKIALVGVSADKNKIGYKMFEDLLASGFNVKGINPGDGKILGQKIYRTLSELEILPDMVITVVKPEITEKIVIECHRLGINNIWMQPGSESEEAVKKAREFNIAVTFNKCFMSENKIW